MMNDRIGWLAMAIAQFSLVSLLASHSWCCSGVWSQEPPRLTRPAETLHLPMESVANCVLTSDQTHGWALKKLSGNPPTFDTEGKAVDVGNWFAYGGRVVGDAKSRLLLVDGSILSGECAAWNADHVIWSSSRWGQLTLPRTLIHAILLRPLASFAQQIQFFDVVSENKSPTDGLYTKDGVWLEGVLREVEFDAGKGLAESTIKWKSKLDRESRTLVLSDVLGMRLTSVPIPIEGSATRLSFTDGESLFAKSWRVDDDGRWVVSLAIPIELASPLASDRWLAGLCGIEKMIESQVRLLNRESPATYRHLPWSGYPLPLGVNRTCFHEPIISDGILYGEGLVTPTSSQVVFRHDGSEGGFCASVRALKSGRDEAALYSGLVAKVLVSRGEGLEVGWKSSPMGSTLEEQRVRLDLRGVRAIVLVTEAQQEFRVPNALVWLYPRIAKERP